GMMMCKKALEASDGDMKKAIDYLREKGLAAAAKKADRIAAEGMVFAKAADNSGVIVEVNSETDFVAKNIDFQKFVSDVADVILRDRPADVDALQNCKWLDGNNTVADMLREKILTIGENIKIRRFKIFEGGVNVAYIHMGGKIGVLLNIIADGIKENAKVLEIGHDIALQIAAMSPSWLSREDVNDEILGKEKEILLAQAINEGKPQQIAEKIVLGKLKKFYSENCLLEQAFVKDDSITVGKYVENTEKELGGKIRISGFVRFEKGEGLEKRTDNFADEVAKMSK
ncbi:MAG: elongation factor Ts, partial [Clostridiales bacterium]|nr:elongation factor Ts [Clostridiales bacterium]